MGNERKAVHMAKACFDGAVVQLDQMKDGNRMSGKIEGDAYGALDVGQGDLCAIVCVVQQELLAKNAVLLLGYRHSTHGDRADLIKS